MRRSSFTSFTLTLIICWSAIAAPPATQPATQIAKLRTVAVVKTWGELLKQEPIDLGDGVQIRLGLEATDVPRHGVILVYCLVEGCKTREVVKFGEDGDGEVLGPLKLTVQLEGRQQLRLSRTASTQCGRGKPGTLLYVGAIDPESRRARVLLAAAGKPIAEASLTVDDQEFHAWAPFKQSESKPVDRLQKNDEPVVIELETGPLYPAVPKVNEIPTEVFFEFEPGQASEPKADTPLPRLLTLAPTDGLELSVSGTTIILKSKLRLPAISRDARQLLTRWWVNDKPVYPDDKQPRSLDREQESTTFDARGEVQFKLRFQPDAIGAKRGDRVGLQLLYNAEGWNWQDGSTGISHKLGELLETADGEVLPPGPHVTNRVEFIAP